MRVKIELVIETDEGEQGTIGGAGEYLIYQHGEYPPDKSAAEMVELVVADALNGQLDSPGLDAWEIVAAHCEVVDV
jgi:hypothetical protein